MINYSNQYFGKDLENLEFSDIENYFVEEKDETDKIEFKAYHPQYGNFNKNLDGVIRGICAFLNSSGGILIWGSPLGVKKNERLIFKGNLSSVSKYLEKDRIISKISDSINPLPVNINVRIIEKKKLFLYIFEIQKSNYSTHQFNNTYWARLDGLTKPAPHYLIDALFKKISYPNIEGYINLDKFGNYNNDYVYLNLTIIIINFSELQNEYDVSYSILCPEAIFEGYLSHKFSKNYEKEGHQYICNDSIDILHFGAPRIISQKIIFNLDNLQTEHNYKINILLMFGGKNSPLKVSEYILDFGIGNISGLNPIELISSYSENITFYEKQKN